MVLIVVAVPKGLFGEFPRHVSDAAGREDPECDQDERQVGSHRLMLALESLLVAIVNVITAKSAGTAQGFS